MFRLCTVSYTHLDVYKRQEMGLEEILNAARILWLNAIEGVNRYGARNAQTTVIAPTGTISFAMDCGATSAEPFYSNVVYKSLSGGGTMEPVSYTHLAEIKVEDLCLESFEGIFGI